MAYNPPNILHAQKELQKLQRASDHRRLLKSFGVTVSWVAVVAIVVALVRAGGAKEAAHGLVANIIYFRDHPLVGALVFCGLAAGLGALYAALALWTNPDPETVAYLPYPPLLDLTDSNDLYVGSGWSVKGKRPGEAIEAEDEPLFGEPHALIPEKGLFGNIHITGAVGGGKTSTGILPMVAQGISKFHPPPRPDPSRLGADGKFPAAAREARRRPWSKRKPTSKEFAFLPPRREHDTSYAGMTLEEAQQLHARMTARWEREKWGIFLIDPKGDMTGIIEQMAAYYGRTNDVRVLRPGGKWTYNPLNVSERSLVQAELVLEGVEAVSGQTIQQFWRTVQTEWLGYAIEILKAVDPKRKTFESVLAMARSESLRTDLVARAEAIMKEAQEEEARLRRLGQRYTGPRVDSQAIAFFREFDGEDSDPRKKGEVTQGIKAQAKYFTADEMIDFLCPKLPSTFEGFPAMIDKGHIVVLQMPPSEFGPVGRVNGILMMSDAMQAARERILRPDMNQDRVLLFVFDEVQNYLNKALRDFLAMNRQSRACVVASHQSQSQLMQQSDRSAEFAFNDNLRNKIAYQAPNADAATKLAQTIGKRTTFVQRWTENTNMLEARKNDKHGRDASGASVSVSQMETQWFAPEEFITLGMGEMIVRLWDGVNTANPRRLEAFPYYKSATAAVASAIPPSPLEIPHPLVRPALTKPADADFLLTALDNTGYVILLPMSDRDGNLVGWWWTTAAGTLVLGLDLLEKLGEALLEKLVESPLLFVTPVPEPVRAYFGTVLNTDLERMLELTQIKLDDDASPEVRAAMADLLDLRRQLEAPGTWEASHAPGDENAQRLSDRGRAIMRAFEQLGAWMSNRADEEIEDWIADSTRPRALIDAEAAHEESDPEVEPTPGPVSAGAGDAIDWGLSAEEIAEAMDEATPTTGDGMLPDWMYEGVDAIDSPSREGVSDDEGERGGEPAGQSDPEAAREAGLGDAGATGQPDASGREAPRDPLGAATDRGASAEATGEPGSGPAPDAPSLNKGAPLN